MPQEGFWAVGGYTICFRKDGAWYADEERIRNPRIHLLFSQSVRPDDREGAQQLPRYTGWLLELGIDREPVHVEDTPLVVTGVDGDRESGFEVCTNDGESEPLDCSTLTIGAGDVLYCTVDRRERGRMRARFLRPPYYWLARYIEWDDHHDHAIIRSRGETYRLV